MRAGEGSVASRIKGEGIVKAGERVKKTLNSLLPFHPSTNIEISEYYINEPRLEIIYQKQSKKEHT